MSRTPYATDGEYTLYLLADIDRENYVELHRQINGESSLFLNPHIKDMMWDSTIHSESKIYSIFDSKGEYCGSTELQNPSSDTPEIGIDLLENKRNQGIAVKVVKMLAIKVSEEQAVNYFLIRISSRNPHSKHVFEKMGAVLIGEGSSLFREFINQLNDEGLNLPTESQDIIQKCFNEEDDEVIYKYKLLPDVFE